MLGHPTNSRECRGDEAIDFVQIQCTCVMNIFNFQLVSYINSAVRSMRWSLYYSIRA